MSVPGAGKAGVLGLRCSDPLAHLGASLDGALLDGRYRARRGQHCDHQAIKALIAQRQAAWASAPGAGAALTRAHAWQRAHDYAVWRGDGDFVAADLWEFERTFYAVIASQRTGGAAFELLLAKVKTPGSLTYSPTILWNTRYGLTDAGRWRDLAAAMPSRGGAPAVSPAHAQESAQRWLDMYQPGTAAGAPRWFPGYYTLPILRNKAVVGLLSVHGQWGTVWYHEWHEGSRADTRQRRQLPTGDESPRGARGRISADSV